MSQVVIHCEQLGKRYQIGQRERYLALRDVLANSLQAPWRLFRSAAPGSSNGRPKHIWALRNASFEIHEGEVVGIVGRNGAGKTTLLKVLARVTKPTEGHAEVLGRMGSLLEVGTGFHPELTGRENTYLSGAILGMSKREIDRKFDEIVAFAEVEQFIDTPLKHYSSGMQMRLAFAVAAHLEPEILLVDEVLAVGDLAFQKKCLGKMGEAARGGRTILFVTHQMNQIRRLCGRALWFDCGQIRQSGAAAEVVGAYEAAMSAGEAASPSVSDSAAARARFLRWEIVEPRADQPHVLTTLGPVGLKIVLQVNQWIRNAHHGIALFSNEDQLMWAWATNNVELEVGTHEFCYTFSMLPLRPGAYSWRVSLYDDNGLADHWSCLPEMIIATEVNQHPLDQWNGVLNVPCGFAIDGGG